MFSVVIKELLPTILEHYKSVGLNGDPFDPDWEALFAAERQHGILIWTARTQGGMLVGYAVVTLSRGLFSCGTKIAIVESTWLDPGWREGLTGIRFLKSIVDATKALGVATKIRIFSNDDYEPMADKRSRVSKAYEHVGFRQTGTMFELAL